MVSEPLQVVDNGRRYQLFNSPLSKAVLSTRFKVLSPTPQSIFVYVAKSPQFKFAYGLVLT